MTSAAPYHFTRYGRSWATLISVVLVWLTCLLALFLFDAAGWIVAVVLLFTLPAVWDLWTGTNAGVSLQNRTLSWYSGNRSVELQPHEIDHIRLVTRIDFSSRAAVVLTTGRKLRLPAEATPPHSEFEAALHAHGLKTERHPFGLL